MRVNTSVGCVSCPSRNESAQSPRGLTRLPHSPWRYKLRLRRSERFWLPDGRERTHGKGTECHKGTDLFFDRNRRSTNDRRMSKLARIKQSNGMRFREAPISGMGAGATRGRTERPKLSGSAPHPCSRAISTPLRPSHSSIPVESHPAHIELHCENSPNFAQALLSVHIAGLSPPKYGVIAFDLHLEA